MTRSLLLGALAGAVALPACLRAPYEHDPKQVADRYSYRYEQPCSSWLTSYKTGFEYCASPPVGAVITAQPAPAPSGSDASGGIPSLTEGPTDVDSLRAHGEQIYNGVCATCHQGNGQGVAGAFPPLAGSGEFYGAPQRHAGIIVHGLSGEIIVQGSTFNSVMAPHGHLTDYDIAAVATYERTSWGNDDGIVLPEDVAAAR